MSTGQFKRDYKRRHQATLDADLLPVLVALANDQRRDHALIGNWKDHRDCHVLIYQKPDADALRLVHLGSHAELGL